MLITDRQSRRGAGNQVRVRPLLDGANERRQRFNIGLFEFSAENRHLSCDALLDRRADRCMRQRHFLQVGAFAALSARTVTG